MAARRNCILSSPSLTFGLLRGHSCQRISFSHRRSSAENPTVSTPPPIRENLECEIREWQSYHIKIGVEALTILPLQRSLRMPPVAKMWLRPGIDVTPERWRHTFAPYRAPVLFKRRATPIVLENEGAAIDDTDCGVQPNLVYAVC